MANNNVCKLSKLKISPFNIRTLTKDEIKEGMEDLKQSIKNKGIIEPLIVRPNGNFFEIVVGQRRFEAGKKIGLKEFPIISKKLSDQEALEYSLIENLQRKDLDSMDIAHALKKDFDMLHGATPSLSIRQFSEQVGKQIGLDQATVWRYLSLLNLAPEVQDMISDDKIGVKLASQLSTVEKDKQEEMAKLISETSIENQATEFIRKVKEEPKRDLEEVYAETRGYATIAILPETKREFLDCREESEKSADDILRKLIAFFKDKDMKQMPL